MLKKAVQLFTNCFYRTNVLAVVSENLQKNHYSVLPADIEVGHVLKSEQ